MSRTIYCRLKGAARSRKIKLSERATSFTIRRLEPNKIHELREEDSDHWQECRANDEGEISLYLYSEGFNC